MPEFHFNRGDIVRRRDDADATGYSVGHGEFTIISIDAKGFIIDHKGGEHHPTRVQLVKPAELVLAEQLAALTQTEDVVNHPSHYKTASGLEAIDVLEAFELTRDFRLGNAGKYLLRAGKKDAELQDVKKARWYLDRYIKHLEAQDA